MKSTGFTKGSDSLSYTALVQTVRLFKPRIIASSANSSGSLAWAESARKDSLKRTQTQLCLWRERFLITAQRLTPTRLMKQVNSSRKHICVRLCTAAGARPCQGFLTSFPESYGSQESSGERGGNYILPFSSHFIPIKHTITSILTDSTNNTGYCRPLNKKQTCFSYFMHHIALISSLSTSDLFDNLFCFSVLHWYYAVFIRAACQFREMSLVN